MTPKGDHPEADRHRAAQPARADQRIYIERWCPAPPPGRRNRVVRYDALDQIDLWDDAVSAVDSPGDDLDAGW